MYLSLSKNLINKYPKIGQQRLVLGKRIITELLICKITYGKFPLQFET